MEKKKTNNKKTEKKKEVIKKKDTTTNKETKTIEISVDKLKTALIVVLVLVIVLGISFMASNGSDSYSKESSSSSSEETSSNDAGSDVQKESESISEDERVELEEVDVSRYLKLMKAEEPSVIYIMRTGCSWCALEDPIMEHIKYQYQDAPIYRLDIANFEDDDSSKFAESDDMFSGSDWGTPTTIVVKDGKIVDSVSGAGTSDALLELFKNNGIISE